MDFFEYFHNDTRRTFPVPTNEHCVDILDALQMNQTFDNYLLDLEDDRVGALMCNIRDMMQTGLYADVIKSAIFYGKYKDFEYELTEFTKDMPSQGEFAVGSQAVELIHALLGIVSESAELSKAILSGVMDNQKFDTVNIKEEIGDIVVYAAVACNALGFTLKDAMETNIAKRAKRFPNGFTTFDAVNRNLDAERSVLESNL